MTAEEYIKNKSMEDFGDFDIDLQENTKLGTYSISEEDAIKAVELARKEEREKAINALDIILIAIIVKGSDRVCFSNIRDRFEKLINQ